MAIIKCPECGKEISDKAAVCIYCGYPINETTNSELPGNSAANNDEQALNPIQYVPAASDPSTESKKSWLTGLIGKVNKKLVAVLAVLFRFMIQIIGGPGFPGQNISAVAFILQLLQNCADGPG